MNLKKIQPIEEARHAPPYLYKILSCQDWALSRYLKAVKLPKEDNLFIHLATEAQLERILAKYWADVPQYVLLKIELPKLSGQLKFEANPGGVNKYYHLYDGFIPLTAVVEARIIQRYPHKAHLLPLLYAGEPILRQTARKLSPAEIMSPEIQTFIHTMHATLQNTGGVGLAAPQVGKAWQLLVIEDKAEYHTQFSPQQLIERNRVPVPFHVIINPILYIEDDAVAEFFEACLSFPNVIGIVPRAKRVRVECLNESAQPVVINATGWYARILQHEIDHVNGILFVDRAKLRTLMTTENYQRLWKERPVMDALQL